jgi:hypothetical protein
MARPRASIGRHRAGSLPRADASGSDGERPVVVVFFAIMETTTPTDPGASIHNGDGSTTPTSRTATELGQRAADAIDAKRDSVARGLDAAASSLQARADRLPGAERVGGAARSTADAMERAADYVREQDVRAMLSDLRKAANRHPGAVLLAAAVLGFMLARAVSRR